MPGDLFHVIDDAFVILCSRGVYRQAKLYRRGLSLYAAFGGGFVKVMGMNGTSAPNVSWREIVNGSMENIAWEHGSPRLLAKP